MISTSSIGGQSAGVPDSRLHPDAAGSADKVRRRHDPDSRPGDRRAKWRVAGHPDRCGRVHAALRGHGLPAQHHRPGRHLHDGSGRSPVGQRRVGQN